MIRRTMVALAAVVLALFGLSVASSAQAAPGAAGVGVEAEVGAAACYPVSWRFVNRWNQNPGDYGCATSQEYQTYNGGFGQNFVNGQIKASPMQGANMIVSGWKRQYWTDTGLHNAFTFRWGVSNPFNYDTWLIRTHHNGVYTGQRECAVGVWLNSCDRTSGSQGWAPVAPGWHSITVEGCDGYVGLTCRQGWTVAVDLLV